MTTDDQKVKAKLDDLRKRLESLRTNKAIYQSRADEAQKKLKEQYGLESIDDILERAQQIDALISAKAAKRDAHMKKAEQLIKEMQANE